MRMADGYLCHVARATACKPSWTPAGLWISALDTSAPSSFLSVTAQTSIFRYNARTLLTSIKAWLVSQLATAHRLSTPQPHVASVRRPSCSTCHVLHPIVHSHPPCRPINNPVQGPTVQHTFERFFPLILPTQASRTVTALPGGVLPFDRQHPSVAASQLLSRPTPQGPIMHAAPRSPRAAGCCSCPAATATAAGTAAAAAAPHPQAPPDPSRPGSTVARP